LRDLHLLIHTVALAAAGLVLGVALWQGQGLWITAKKMAAAYLACFCLGVLAALALRSAADPPIRRDPAPQPEQGSED
jgi:hypothetical protein